MYLPNLKCVALPIPEKIAIGVLQTPDLGEGVAVGVRDVTVRKSVGVW